MSRACRWRAEQCKGDRDTDPRSVVPARRPVRPGGLVPTTVRSAPPAGFAGRGVAFSGAYATSVSFPCGDPEPFTYAQVDGFCAGVSGLAPLSPQDLVGP